MGDLDKGMSIHCILLSPYERRANSFLQNLSGVKTRRPTLSLSLHTVCMEVLSSNLIAAHETKQIQGLKIARSAPYLSHLFFLRMTLYSSLKTSLKCAGISKT